MSIELMKLPYAEDALEPHISKETIEYHYGKHHKTYVENLNKLVVGTKYEDDILEDIVTLSTGAIFNNASQILNHNFYWNCLTPNETKMSDNLTAAINADFGSFDKLKEDFNDKVKTLFGCGWVWLVQRKNGKLDIFQTLGAASPMSNGLASPLLVCDVWEHAYYIDHRNDRVKYLEDFWKLVNWEFVSKNFKS